MTQSTEIAEYLEELQQLLFFRPLSADEIQDFVGKGEILACEFDDRIVKEGEFDPSFYVVIRGSVNVMVKQKSEEVFICAIGAGDVFGEASIFSKVKRTAAVIAAEETVLLRIQRPSMMSFIKENPRGGNKVLMLIIFSLLRKLRGTNQELAFERRLDINQDDVDALVDQLTGNGG